MKSLAWLLGSVFLFTACDTGAPIPTDGSVSAADLSVISDGGGTGNDDGGGGLNLCKGAGCIGAPCAADSECTEGKTGAQKTCWKTLLNKEDNLVTAGGYCTQECQSDVDCGTAVCTAIAGQAKKFCMARCRSTGVCRDSYACAYEGREGICYPNGNFDCDPTVGACDTKLADGTIVNGGCIRAAYENRGICRIACQVGTKTCPPDLRLGAGSPIQQHCVFLDMTVNAAGGATGDRWKGPVCLGNVATPIVVGQRCNFWDECEDGAQCNRFGALPEDRVCRRLCAQGSGQQSSALYSAPGGTPANNMCPDNGTCRDSLRAGVTNGSPGLCIK